MKPKTEERIDELDHQMLKVGWFFGIIILICIIVFLGIGISLSSVNSRLDQLELKTEYYCTEDGYDCISYAELARLEALSDEKSRWEALSDKENKGSWQCDKWANETVAATYGLNAQFQIDQDLTIYYYNYSVSNATKPEVFATYNCSDGKHMHVECTINEAIEPLSTCMIVTKGCELTIYKKQTTCLHETWGRDTALLTKSAGGK